MSEKPKLTIAIDEWEYATGLFVKYSYLRPSLKSTLLIERIEELDQFLKVDREKIEEMYKKRHLREIRELRDELNGLDLDD